MDFEILKSCDDMRDRGVVGVGVCEGEEPSLPDSLARVAAAAAERENFKGKAGSTLVLPLAEGATHALVLVGLGKRDKVTANTYRVASFKIVRAAASRGASSVAIALPGADESASRAIGEGATLAVYRFDKYKKQEDDSRFKEPDSVAVVGADGAALAEGRVLALAQMYARDLANEPGNVIDPATFEAEARRVAEECGLGFEVLHEDELASRGMNALLAVGSGSKTPPRLIHLTYAPKGEPRFKAALVGKGLTFDSGGLSLKPADAMLTMKGDKTGACVVLGVMRAISQLELPVKVDAVMGMAENMPSGSAYRPDDIIRASNGKTIEVNNTDAEGRLTLADALVFACGTEPDFVLDIATLTGACAVALGDTTAGLFSNDDALADEFLGAAKRSGERFWRLPMDDENLREKIKSPVADVVNSGGRYGGAITAAMFLEKFVADGTPWLHLDIAATDFAKKGYAYYTKGATAYGCRTIATFILDRSR